MARNKRDRLKNSGLQLNASLDNNTSSLKDWDDDLHPTERDVPQPVADDPLVAQLSAQGYRRTVQAAGGKIQRNNFEMTMTGLHYTGDVLTLEDWVEMGEWLTQLRDAIQWMIGDWANLGAQHMESWLPPEDVREIEASMMMDDDNEDAVPPGKYKWLAETVDYKYGTLRNFAYIAAAFPVSRRRDTLTYSHHVEVAKLDQETQERLLRQAEKGKPDDSGRQKRLSVRELRELVQQELSLSFGSEGDLADQVPIYRSLLRLKHDLPRQWAKLSASQKRQIHDDLTITLQQINKLGLD